MMIDTHTHSRFSHDGRHEIAEVVAAAKQKGIKYLAITDHCDYDYLALPGYEVVRQLDLSGYLEEMERTKKTVEGIDFAIGLELGYHRVAVDLYKKNVPFERLDYIINSVHTVDNHDVYFPSYFDGITREESYKKYLLSVLESVSVEYAEFSDILDSILQAVIDKGKTLEINSNIRFDDSMPNISILERYRQLGGENIIYGSDAHVLNRLGEGYEKIKEIALSLGFRYWTVYNKLQPSKIKI
jgi:histidinol-phosphatase (PHP family)